MVIGLKNIGFRSFCKSDGVEHHFFKSIFALCYSNIPSRVADTKTDIKLLLKFVTKYFTLFHLVKSFFSSQISKLNFD